MDEAAAPPGSRGVPALRRFLVVRTGALGDIVHGIPVAAALKRAYPHVRVEWVVEERYAGLLRCVPWVDACIPVWFRDGVRHLADPCARARWRHTLRRLRRSGYDVTLDLQGLIRSGLISGWTRSQLRFGFPLSHVREWPNVLFSNVRPRRMPQAGHVIDRNLALLHPLGIRCAERVFSYRVPGDVEERVGRYVRSTAPGEDRVRVAVHPVAGWPTKEWPLERYAEIVRRICRAGGTQVFVLWGPGERERVAGCFDLAGAAVQPLPQMGPMELLAFLRWCDLYVGGDSGPMQMASSLGKPVVALFGPTDPGRNGPFLGRHRVVWGRAPCAPCYRRRCSRTDCMDGVDVERVWRAVAAFLEEIRAAGNGRSPEHVRVSQDADRVG